MTDELREALEAELTAVMCHKSGGYDPLSPADIAAHLAPILERAFLMGADGQHVKRLAVQHFAAAIRGDNP